MRSLSRFVRLGLLTRLTLVAGSCAPHASPAGVAAVSRTRFAEEPAPVTDASSKAGDRMPVYPFSRRTDDVDVVHGVSVADPYRWLEDGSSPEVRAWADAQDALARRFLAGLEGRAAIEARVRELFYVESAGTPRRAGSRWFFPRRDAGKEKFKIYWREGRSGEDQVLLDPSQWAADGSKSLGVWNVSHDGTKVAYTIKSNNSDEATLHVMDVATGAVSAIDVIEGAKYAWPSWTPSGSGFYYTWVPVPVADGIDPADRPGYAEVRFHELGKDPRTDRVVHEKTGNPKSFLGAAIDRTGRWLVATIEHGWSRTDVFFQDLHAAKPVWRPLAVGQDARYDVSVDRDRFFVLTNEGAPRSRVFRVDPAQPERDRWSEIIAERPDATLEGVSIVGHHLSLAYLKDVASQLELRSEDGALVRNIELPGLGSASSLSGEVDDDVAYYSFQSFTYPTEIFETSVGTGNTSTWYRVHVPADPSKYDTEQLFATSRDGTRVPFFVVRARDFQKNGSAPAMLYGYGGFQAAQTPYFASSIFPWLERGGIWVIANLRGGSEYGEAWHRGGMGHAKQNVFDDYFAVAQELIARGYTTADHLAALGGSNGGLLVGAAVAQRPDLFRVALCAVPLLDMVRYQRFGSGKTWSEEYGSVDDPDDFAALYAYSPYHHIDKGKKYPSILLLSADSDDRVDPMHARKFAAELQWASSGGPVLLRIEKHAGHGGADLVRAAVERVADEYAFALAFLMAPPVP
ncbi:MAG TPA: prolyl oligopeptidase family serine peptidase [Polyangiaceae bacterium]|nr:prolyl oligopeptidase family serine peptidase [Polyangiaceae bacterium]